jgi:hypothetical protein
MNSSASDQDTHCWACAQSLNGSAAHECGNPACLVCPQCGETLCSYSPERKEALRQSKAPRRQSSSQAGPSRHADKGEVRQRIQPYDAYTLRRLIAGQSLNGELLTLAVAFQPLAEHLDRLPLEHRPVAFDGFLCSRPDRGEIVTALADVDLEGPPPEAEPPMRPANLADLRRVMAESQWLWPSYIPASRIAGIAAFEGVGKTRLAMDLARRIYFNLPWPGGQPATLPERTPTLWICADGQQDDLAEAAQAFGLPDEAIYFNTFPDDPYGGNELDDPDSLTRLENFIAQVRPGLVFVDTLTNATSRNLCQANDVKDLMTPLRDIAQQTQTTIIVLLHLGKEGQALGKRVMGITRTILQLDCPDRGQTERLKPWVSKSFAKAPPALGVTMTDAGNDYDRNPPTAPESRKAGRPPKERNRAENFIRDELTRQNHQLANDINAEWMKTDGTYKTFWRAVEELEAAGELTREGGPGTGRQTVLHLNTTEPNRDPDTA